MFSCRLPPFFLAFPSHELRVTSQEFLHIQIPYFLRVGLYEFPTGFNLVPHKDTEVLISGDGVLDIHPLAGASCWGPWLSPRAVRGSFPEPLVALDAQLAALHALLQCFQFLFAVAVMDLLAACTL